MNINDHVKQYPENEAGNVQSLISSYDYMDSFKQVLDTSTYVEIDYLSQNHPVFHHFAILLE
jgi:hypothetical protein